MDNKIDPREHRTLKACQWKSPVFLIWAVMFGMSILRAVCALAQTSPAEPASTSTAAGSSLNSSDGNLSPGATDAKPAREDAQSLVGHNAGELEAALGKPAGKLQTAQGALWLYADLRVQFDQKGHVLKIEKDQPLKLAKLDPQFIAVADAISKAQAERSAADDIARAKANAPQVEDLRTISNGGQQVDLPSLLAEDKITIVNFYAEWCASCRQINPELERLAKEDPDIVLLKVDIVNWNTPVTRQFDIHSVPNVRVFDPTKKQIGQATSDVTLVKEGVKQAKRS